VIPFRVFGLPLHVLVVHLTVVTVPVAALVVAAAAVNGRARRWLGIVPVVAAGLAVILVPISTNSGEQLQARLPDTAAIRNHAHLAGGLLPWVLVLLAGATALVWLSPRTPTSTSATGATTSRTTARWLQVPAGAVPRLRLLASALALAGAAGTVVQVVRIGHSGANAVWKGVATQPPAS
jgi:uncharacterized membrane protein